jgi:CheB methylesterase
MAELPPSQPSALVVGIGASAGGLDAFKRFLASTPVDTGMAFVLVQHLDPHHKSLLVELLGSQSPIPVVAAKDGLAVKHAVISRRFLIERADAAKLRSVIASRYSALFQWLQEFRSSALTNGFAGYRGTRKYITGLRSSDVDRRNRAVRSAVRWIARY